MTGIVTLSCQKRKSTDAKITGADLDNIQNLIDKAVTKSLAKHSQKMLELKDELAEINKDQKDMRNQINALKAESN